MARSSTDVVDARVSLREEMAGGDLGDDRLNARRDRLIDVLERSPATGFPEACASDGDAEALYRFLRNPRVSLRAVLEPHLAATQARCRALDEVLVIHGVAGPMPRRTTHPARRPVALAVLDVDGDGRLELVVANQDSDELSLIDGDAP